MIMLVGGVLVVLIIVRLMLLFFSSFSNLVLVVGCRCMFIFG